MGSLRTVLRTGTVVLAALISLAALVSGASGLAGRGGTVNVESAWPTLITGLACTAAVVTYAKRLGWWWILGCLGAAGHLWAHLGVLARAPDAAGHSGRLLGLFAVPTLWILLIVAMAALRIPKTEVKT